MRRRCRQPGNHPLDKPAVSVLGQSDHPNSFFFFFTLVTGLKRSLSLTLTLTLSVLTLDNWNLVCEDAVASQASGARGAGDE